MKDDIQALARDCVKALVPYQSARRIGGRGDVWLNANEYPRRDPLECRFENLNRYPSSQPEEVVRGYAAYAGVDPGMVVVTRGADEAIELLIRAFCEPGRDALLYCPPTYGMYSVSAEAFGVELRAVPAKKASGWSLDLAGIEAALPGAKLVFVCSPNNPTGQIVPREELESLAQMTAGRAVLVVDEAYIEFAAQKTVVDFLQKYPHVAVLRTLSKAFALAGIRTGFVLANSPLIGVLLKVIAPYPVPTPVAQIAAGALSDSGIREMKARVAQVLENRAWFLGELARRSCVRAVYPTDTNYVLVEFADAGAVFSAMSAKGIVLRSQRAQPGLQDTIRVTIGTRGELERVLAVLDTFSA